MYNNVNVNHPLIHRENTYVSIKKNVSIHSDDRDKSKWPNASEFEVELPQPLKQVQYMKLTNMTLPSDLCNISSTYQNNKLLFGYDTSTTGYIRDQLEISYTSGCGTGATVTTVIIASGSVSSIDVDGGTGYKAGDVIVITVNGTELGTYTIVAGDLSSGVFNTGNLTGTMPLNYNTIIDDTYNNTVNMTPKVITVPDGLYTAEELAETLESLINKELVSNYEKNADTAGVFIVKYNKSEKKFYFGSTANSKNFSLFFDERAHKYILSQSNGYGLCPQNNDQYYTKKNWGLGALLGFEKRNYRAVTKTGSSMCNTVINNHNEINSEIGVSSTNYSDSLATKQSKVWLPVATNIIAFNLSSAVLPIMFLPTTIYMEVDKYNNSDELVPHVNNTSSSNITHNLKSNSDKYNNLHETCNTGGAIDTLSYKRGLDSSNRTNNIKQRNAFATNHIPTGDYGGRTNSYFAKLSMPNATNKHYINIPGDDIKTITLFSNQLEERVQKLKVKFRFHDGTVVDFGSSDINFTIEFGTVLSDQEKNMKIRNIH